MNPVKLIAIATTLLFMGCESPTPGSHSDTQQEYQSYHTFNQDQVFPGDGSLLRAEDGTALTDGRIIVIDQAHGLRLVETDGSSRPFGDFASAGYSHNPPDKLAGPNGMILEKDGEYILVADVFSGEIYRVNIQTEEVKMIYNHPYGVNAVYRDKTGALWFTQSTHSTNMGELFRDVNLPVPHGAVYRMADLTSNPVLMVDSLYFANGITMDKEEKYLYVAETMMDRVMVYDIDVAKGLIRGADVAAHVGTPDNLTLDDKGRLIVASPIFSQVVAVDFDQRSLQVLYDGSTVESRAISGEWVRRSHLGMELLELLGPSLTAPLPGLVTGMFYSSDYKTLYITNLGNDLIKVDLE